MASTGPLNSEALLRAERIFFAFKEKCASDVISDFTMSLYPYEFVSIIGPNGCGKTTLLRLMAGLLPPRSGDVYFHGKSMSRPNPQRFIVRQHPTLYPWKTVRANIELVLRATDLAQNEVRERVCAAISSMGLDECADLLPHILSGGQKQRVELAKVFALRPSVLLLDEPFSSIDRLTRESFQDMLLDLVSKTHSSAMFVTHDISEAIYLSDRILVLSNRPATIAAEVAINTPRPRKRTSLASCSDNDAISKVRQALSAYVTLTT